MQAQQGKEAAPPSYASVVSPRDAIPSSFGDASAASIERLRNFLCYIMAVEYAPAVNLSTINSIRLSEADADHFMQLDRLRRITKTCLDNDMNTALGAYLREHVHATSRALGLRSENVMVYISYFAWCIQESGTYTGCCWDSTARVDGIKKLARKSAIDRREIIPRVAPNPAFEQRLLESNKNIIEYWLNRFAGSTYTVARYHHTGHCHKVGAFESSEITRHYETPHLLTKHRALREKVKRCLRRMEQAI